MSGLLLLRPFLSSVSGASASAADELCARVAQRMASRDVEAALKARVVELEEQARERPRSGSYPHFALTTCRPSTQAAALSARVGEQRRAVPAWAVQRLEEGQASELSQLLALGNATDEALLGGGIGDATLVAPSLLEERSRCEAARDRAGGSALAVDKALEDAVRLQQQLSAALALPVTSVDEAIAGKENEGGGKTISAVQRGLQLQKLPPAKRARV
ncbi:hypothetical protein EMIHUDRAFT_209437 [Emiliania huxleyi CCMP1516]|uniref:Uncharacterized protein n=2 Tax=Emiliania huxleyi TaxID=2903 RepID=A0A0D3J5Q1_EMIH1|nr:hypothetical protein EMIHUDRAFT_209437 [Emiliania huxleyi CCMP1516]EOD18836.1 hypothetical protein EMIHUDRAFT_209437 [Emiliania huxleyi CCMP1516]|eukprot:XP_005771265.1 hypothetical protein EMIHUDRAFT_209437 [Emiliania huxleyi CCMP1516]